MVNKVILIGNLGRDPEIRDANGQKVGSFTLATTRKWKDREGARQEKTEWHQVVVWGRQAEVAEMYLRKGRQVYVEGRLQTRSWDDKQTGEKRYRTEVIVENFQMLGKGGADKAEMKHPPAAAAATTPSGPYVDDEDVPF